MKFDVPVAEAKPLIEEARTLLDGPVEGLIAEHGRDHGHEPGLEPDGSLAGHVRAFKRSIHRLGAEAGLYAPNISERLGGRGTSLRTMMYLHEEVFLRGFRGQHQGLTVEILDPGKDKETSGAEVRHLMRSGLPWEHLVPDAASRVIRETLATDRLRL